MSKPIPFSAPLVLAMIDRRKNVTRRLLQKPELYGCPTGDCPHVDYRQCIEAMNAQDILAKCPFGGPGDRLWVKEAWRPFWDDFLDGEGLGDCIQYRADGALMKPRGLDVETGHKFSDMCDPEDPNPRWRMARFMFKWASRITLEVVSRRLEPVGYITPEDVAAEGFIFDEHPSDGSAPGWTLPGLGTWHRTTIEAFAAVWDRLHVEPHCQFHRDPWVWRVQFKVLEVRA